MVRFYGDRLYFPDNDAQIERKGIESCKIYPWGIKLQTSGSAISISFNLKVAQWLNPFFLIESVVLVVVFLLAAIFSFLELRNSFLFPPFFSIGICLLYSVLNVALAVFFFRYLKTNLRKSFFVISTLYFFLNIPLLLYLPLSTPFWAFFVILYSLYLSVVLLFPRSSFQGRIFIAFLWILLSVSSYQWFVVSLKVYVDSNLKEALGQENRKLIVKKGIYEWYNFKWKKPILWQVREIRFWEKFSLGREIIFQTQPIEPVRTISLPDQGLSGWIGFVSLKPEKFLRFLSDYFKGQKHLIWAKLLEQGQPKISSLSSEGKIEQEQIPPKYPNNKLNLMLQQFLFFDFYKQEEVVLNFVLFYYGEEDRAMIFCLKQPVESSFRYYLNEISKGFK